MVGGTVSITVTIAMQVLELELPSVTVRVSETAPTSLQLKLVCDAESVTGPQLSVDPPSMSAAVMLPVPPAFRNTVTFWQTATGGIESVAVKVNEQESVLPATSIVINVIETTVPAPDTVVPATGDCVTLGEGSQLSVTVAELA